MGSIQNAFTHHGSRNAAGESHTMHHDVNKLHHTSFSMHCYILGLSALYLYLCIPQYSALYTLTSKSHDLLHDALKGQDEEEFRSWASIKSQDLTLALNSAVQRPSGAIISGKQVGLFHKLSQFSLNVHMFLRLIAYKYGSIPIPL